MSEKSSKKTTTRIKKVNQEHKTPGIKTRLKSLRAQPISNVAVLGLLLLSVFGTLRYLQSRPVQGQVKFIEQSKPGIEERLTNDDRVSSAPEIFQGEVYDTSIRLREAGALGMAISLAVFTTGAEQGIVPPNLEKVWSKISERKLMPPGVALTNGELISPSGKIIVRYQSVPLRFEILSIPRQNSNSPTLMLRFPLDRLDGRTITYFQSTSVNSRDVPPPFAPIEKIVSAGWTLNQWRGEIMPKAENNIQLLEEERRLLQVPLANR